MKGSLVDSKQPVSFLIEINHLEMKNSVLKKKLHLFIAEFILFEKYKMKY